MTPWLIDIIDEDLASFACRLNGWLRPGGRWVNSGSLAFSGDDPARRYALEEVLDVVAAAGFSVDLLREDAIPYLGSPASRHARLETVVTFTAVKREQSPAAGAGAPIAGMAGDGPTCPCRCCRSSRGASWSCAYSPT